MTSMLATGHRYISFNRSTEFIRDLFADSGATMLELPLKNSIQQKYTRGVVETELIVHNLPTGLSTPAGPSSGRVLAEAGWPVGSSTSRGFVPVAMTPDQHRALVAMERTTGLPAGELARRAVGRFLAAEPGGAPIRNAGAPA